MNPSPSVVEPTSHDRAWELLPWLTTDRLDPEERAQTLEHLKSCGVCRGELRFLPELEAAVEATPERSPERGLRAVNARIDALESRTKTSSRRRWALAASLLAVLALWPLVEGRGVPDAEPSGPASFRTLSSESSVAEPPRLRVVVASDTTVTELGLLLEESRLRLVEGPSLRGVATLEATDGRSDLDVLAGELRQLPELALVEVVGRPAGERS